MLLNVIYTCVLQGVCCTQQCIRSTEYTQQLLLDRMSSVKCKLSRSGTTAMAGSKTPRNVEVTLAPCYQYEQRQKYHVQQDSAATLCKKATGNEEEAISAVWSARWLCHNKACKAGT